MPTESPNINVPVVDLLENAKSVRPLLSTRSFGASRSTFGYRDGMSRSMVMVPVARWNGDGTGRVIPHEPPKPAPPKTLWGQYLLGQPMFKATDVER